MVKNVVVFERPFKEKNVIIRQYEVPMGTTHLGRGVFQNCEFIRQISLPETLKDIGSVAFFKCSLLEDIVLPEGLRSIGDRAFTNCLSLSKINLPKSVTFIDTFAFTDCVELDNVVLPKKLKVLGGGAFDGCKKLKEIEIPNSVTDLHAGVFRGCESLTKLTFPKNATKVPGTFLTNCRSLKNIELPKKIIEIDDLAFQGCASLESIKLPKKVKILGRQVFKECGSLNNVELNSGLREINSSAFYECSSLKEIKLPNSLRKLGSGAFYACEKLTKVNIPKRIKTINSSTFGRCVSLTSIDISHIEEIDDYAFKGCTSLKEIVIPANLKSIGHDVFTGCSFKYIYKIKGQKNIVYSIEPPQNSDKVEKLIEIDKIKGIAGFDIGQLAIEENISKIMPIVEKLNRAKMVLPNSYFNELAKNNALDLIADEMNFKFFPKEMQFFADFIAKDDTINKAKSMALLKFATAMGCFSNEKLLDRNGMETPTPVAQKASSTLAAMYRSGVLEPVLLKYFKKLPYNVKPSQEFLKFISLKEGDKYPNLDLLIKLEDHNEGFISKAVSRFEEVKGLRRGIDEKGKPYTVSWADALVKFSTKVLYNNTTKENEDISELFQSMRLKQADFDKASKNREEARKTSMPAHILGKELKEETILERIERLKNDTTQEVADGGQVISGLYERMFTYEMLDKYDPKNAIIGIYCSCCATISSGYYGHKIVDATMTAHDVQNMVVRDAKGEIVAKGSMYINKKRGYVVINDFEMNEKFKAHETQNGYYEVEEGSKEAKEREQIFGAFRRGIAAFVEEYDKQNPNKPIKMVTVGQGYNRLAEQCKKFSSHTANLEVPNEYSFQDAKEEKQIVLYERGKTEQELKESKDIDAGRII